MQCIFTGGNPSRFSATFRALSRYLQRPFNRLSDCQIRYHAARRYGRPAAERLKLDVRENPVFHLDLNLHEVPAHRIPDHPHTARTPPRYWVRFISLGSRLRPNLQFP